MSKPEHPDLIVPAIAGAIELVVTIAAAVPEISKRLGRVSDIRREIGRIPEPVKYFYVWAQEVYLTVLIAISLIGIIAVLVYIYATVNPDADLGGFIYLKDHGFLIAAFWAATAVAMYTNLISRIIAALWWAASVFPFYYFVPPRQQNIAWPALRDFIDRNDNAAPLFISAETAAGFADQLIRMIEAETAKAPNRAEAPQRPAAMPIDEFRVRLGNALLLGTLIEGGQYARLGFPRREWNPFYTAVAELALESQLLTPTTIKHRALERAYCDELTNQLNARLQASKQPAVPQSTKLEEIVKDNFGTLAQKYDGNAAKIGGAESGIFSKAEVIRSRVQKMPFWGEKSEGMRAQFIKLCNVWGVWEGFEVGDFEFPFSKGIATLLLDKGVILATQETKVLSFESGTDRIIARLAESAVVQEAISLVERDLDRHRKWLPEESKRAHGDLLHWWIAYEIDFRMWDFAKRMSPGDSVLGSFANWKLLGGQIKRVEGA
jgi:hypothetical protein